MEVVNNQEVAKIELFIACRGLRDMDTFSKSDPQVIMYIKNPTQNKWDEYAKTEAIYDNLNPNFVKTFIIDYHFEKQQQLKFDVIDIDGPNVSTFDFIGSCETTLGAIVGAKNQTQVLGLKDKKNIRTGKIIFRAEKVMQCMEYLEVEWEGKKLVDTHFLFGKTCPFLRFYKIIENQPPLLVYQTLMIKNNLNPQFEKMEVNLGKLANGDINSPVEVELWDYNSSGKHKLMGSFKFTTNSLINENIREFKVFSQKQKLKGTIIANNPKLDIRPRFLDFIRGGTQLALITAVDFTASNGDPDTPQSLHALKHNALNQYQAAIAGVGQILLQYDHDKQVPMYGFGGKPKMPNLNSDQVLHCFPMNGNPQNPEVDKMDGIMKCYSFALNNIIFSGPTLFAPLIKETMKVCQEAKQNQIKNPMDDQYQILLILTDGEIHDMEETKRCLVNSSHLPLSIIIIGIGDADFENMEILDGDDGLWDSEGNKAQRDLVQFVPFNKFKGNPTLLAEQVLEELPLQVEEYMQLIKRKPKEKQPFQRAYSIQSCRTQVEDDIDYIGNMVGNENGTQYYFEQPVQNGQQNPLQESISNLEKYQYPEIQQNNRQQQTQQGFKY